MPITPTPQKYHNATMGGVKESNHTKSQVSYISSKILGRYIYLQFTCMNKFLLLILRVVYII